MSERATPNLHIKLLILRFVHLHFDSRQPTRRHCTPPAARLHAALKATYRDAQKYRVENGWLVLSVSGQDTLISTVSSVLWSMSSYLVHIEVYIYVALLFSTRDIVFDSRAAFLLYRTHPQTLISPIYCM